MSEQLEIIESYDSRVDAALASLSRTLSSVPPEEMRRRYRAGVAAEARIRNRAGKNDRSPRTNRGRSP